MPTTTKRKRTGKNDDDDALVTPFPPDAPTPPEPKRQRTSALMELDPQLHEKGVARYDARQAELEDGSGQEPEARAREEQEQEEPAREEQSESGHASGEEVTVDSETKVDPEPEPRAQNSTPTPTEIDDTSKLHAVQQALQDAGYPTLFAFLDALLSTTDPGLSSRVDEMLVDHGYEILELIKSYEPEMVREFAIRHVSEVWAAEARGSEDRFADDR